MRGPTYDALWSAHASARDKVNYPTPCGNAAKQDAFRTSDGHRGGQTLAAMAVGVTIGKAGLVSAAVVEVGVAVREPQKGRLGPLRKSRWARWRRSLLSDIDRRIEVWERDVMSRFFGS